MSALDPARREELAKALTERDECEHEARLYGEHEVTIRCHDCDADALAPLIARWLAEARAEVVRAVEAELDDADQITDSLERPNHITVWGVRRTLMEFGGKPHRWKVPAEKCAECGHHGLDHDPEGDGECAWDDCGCLLSRREAHWGRDEAADDEIRDAIWEDAVLRGEPWAMQDHAALTPPDTT